MRRWLAMTLIGAASTLPALAQDPGKPEPPTTKERVGAILSELGAGGLKATGRSEAAQRLLDVAESDRQCQRSEGRLAIRGNSALPVLAQGDVSGLAA
jgi:hypothetical protein